MAGKPLFQQHHGVDQKSFGKHALLRALVDNGRLDKDAATNLINLPNDKDLARAIGVTPHTGRHIKEYPLGIRDALNELAATKDGQAVLLPKPDPNALDRVALKVQRLGDTVQIALINGDLRTNNALGETMAQTRAITRAFYRDPGGYAGQNLIQLDAHAQLSPNSRQWAPVTYNEGRIVSTLQHFQSSGRPLLRDGDLDFQRNSLSQAIADAYHDGRLTISPGGVAVVENTLGEEAANSLRVPRGQRGEVTMELLMGEASARGLIRAGGLLATGADAVMTARTAATLMEQGNLTAAQSEVTHALARNVGGWAGGASTAAALGGSGFVPAALVVGDALLMSKAFDKGADLLDNRAIYHQTDKAGVEWQFNGRDWERQAAFDGSSGHPTQEAVGASYAKSKELGAMANAKAVELALGKAPPPQDPFNLPAQASDQVGLDNQNWHRNPATETWERPVKTGVTGADDRGVYEPQIANAEQTQRLNQEALARIETNIGTGREAIAQAYLESHAAQRGQDYGVGVPAAVESAHAKPDRVQGHDGQTYQRHESGQWAGKDGVASGNLAAELELTNQMRQPSLERAQETLAAIEARPAPTAAEMEHNELLHRYRAAGVDLNVNPQTQQAVELAAQRTRDANGITGPTMQQLQRNEAGQYGYDSPIAHLQQGPDGIARVVAVTSSDDIRQALSETQGNRRESPTLGRVLEGTADADTSTSESSNPQQVLDIQARMQASVAAQARQEREQQDRLAQEQHAAQVREHLQQAQPEHEDRSQSEQAVQAHAALEGQRQAEQQRELEERQVQERQVQTSQQRELQEREERDAQQRQEQERQAEDNQQREQQDRQAQETRQVGAQEGLARQAQQQDQHQEASHQPDPQLHAPDAVLVQQTLRPELQQAGPYQQLDAHNQQVGERAAHTTLDQRTQATGPGDAHPHHAQEAARALERQALESRDAAHLQVPPSGDRESGGQPAQSVQADAVSPALYRHVQTQPAEMEQALIRQQDVKREQEAAPVRVMAQITPAGQSLGGSVENRFPTAPADVENRQAQSIPGQDRSAADPGGALFLEETMRSLRQLQQEIELADREDERFHQEWKEYRDRGEPYPFAHHDTQRVQGASLDGFPQHEQARRSPSGAAEQTDAFPPLAQRSIGPGGKDASSDSSQVERKSITGDPDVDEVLYALDSKNELAIEQALNRVANSAATQALIKRGNEFLEAQAQQEAQEHVATRQALGMDVSAEINTSRGPVMVMTLPEFAKGPMQSGPQGGGGGGGDGGGGGGSGGGGGG
ncbi:AHH domain-containing protein [Xanthomonas graminis]|uniref:AHH domain-containing protein n=1 Tax=Xanthomonas graminis TaxID=3390026 RepID=UPI0009BDD9C8|nr:AHH domain-containing protein [Xanthomonas translucens]